MAATIILLILLIIVLLVIALFSLNLNIVVSFYASTEEDKLYRYAISVRNSAPLTIFSFELFRTASGGHKKKKPQKKKNKGTRLWEKFRSNLKKFKPYIEIHNLSYVGQIAFGSADHTALAAGSLNSAAGVFTAFLSSLASKIFVSGSTSALIMKTKSN